MMPLQVLTNILRNYALSIKTNNNFILSINESFKQTSKT